MTEGMVQYHIYRHHDFKRVLPNIHTDRWGGSEVDALYWTNADRVYFYEIKLSKSDFKADLKKKRHYQLSARDEGMSIKPKYFWYVCSGFTISPTEIPEYAGLILCSDHGLKMYPQPAKKAPLLWKEPITKDNIDFLNKKICRRFTQLIYKPKAEEWLTFYESRAIKQ